MSQELLEAVARGEAPLSVYADWCEEQGDPLSAGIRRLADEDRFPRRDEQGWYWRVDLKGRITQKSDRSILPEAIWQTMYPGLGLHRYDKKRFVGPRSYPRSASAREAIELAAAVFE